ncbi:MAG: Flp pilus assembly complex ATPase component TadA [Opitutales bacterium]|nr:Flp pilus assembly complex ATPase component TadA [Opitutales bacterium]
MALARIQRSIVDNLVLMGKLAEDQASRLITSPEEMSGDAVEQMLTKEFGVTEFHILVAKAKACDLPPFNARSFIVGDKTFEKLDKDFCKENKVLPVGVVGERLVIAVSNPFNLSVANLAQEEARMKVVLLLALEAEIEDKLKDKQQEQHPRSEGFGDVVDALSEEYTADVKNLDDENLEEESAPIIKLANRIIEDAYYSGGSDIHIEPFETFARVRVRVDGICHEKLRVPPKVATALLARLKVMSNLDIAEKRLPQDGRIVYKQFNRKGLDIDLRVATAPLNHGEGVVMRILDKQKSTLPLTALGYSDENLAKYRELIIRPYGMILHCGPTGSGKSMTLYSALNEINEPDTVIRTAEDPIEYTLPGLCQMQMHRKIGLTFASALRAFLRQDPDIILVGEIRDSETAQIAIEAALTGHLLFSTLHTNDAPSAIPRLTDMGVEPFMISASLLCVCAQRLMRRVCKNCKQQYTLEGREAELFQTALKWHGSVYGANPHGCPVCGGAGYKGRVGIHELMTVSDELVHGINCKMEASKLKRIAVRGGMATLHQDSLLKVKQGTTTLVEAIATVPPDMEDLDKIRAALTLEQALL